MEYNTQLEDLKMGEYGRNIQKLIEHLHEVKDEDKRNKYADVIIEIMAQSKPNLKNNAEFRQKLWNDLYFLSEYKITFKEPCTSKPNDNVVDNSKKLNYPSNKMKYPHYGSNIEKMINETIELKEEDKKDKFTLAIAAYMKMAYRNWNKSNVTDEQILADLEKISGGKLTFDKNNKIINLVERSYTKKPFKKHTSKNHKRRNYR